MSLFSFVLPNGKLFILTLISIAIFCCFRSGFADDSPAQLFTKALLCFNNKFIYSGCDEEYRLNESGNLHVPFEVTDLFCHGPCLAETQLVLNCVENVFSNFIFFNRATVPDVRNVLNMACSYSDERGNFNLARYIEGITSGGQKVANINSFYSATALLTGTCFFILW